MKDVKACQNCIFFNIEGPYDGEGGMEKYTPQTGQCRRYPPKPDATIQLWPVIRTNDWCGEFVKK